MTFERFEELGVWSEARALARKIYEISESVPFSRDYVLKDQIRRAVISISSNIAEEFERGGNKGFVQFLYVAKGSCGEVRSQLYLVKDLAYTDEALADDIIQSTEELSKMISGFI